MRKMSWKPTNRTWLLLALVVAAAIFGVWTLRKAQRVRQAAAPPVAASLSPAATQARAALAARTGGEVELLYLLEPIPTVVCGYYGKKAERPGQPVSAASFVFQDGKLFLAQDKGADYRAFQKSACGPQWSQPAR